MDFLYLHRIVRNDTLSTSVNPDRSNAMSESEFAGLLASSRSWLSNWTDGITPRPEGADVQPGVALTFDDGYRDFKEVALPHIERAGVRVLLFVTTQFADQQIKPYEYVVGELLRLRPDLQFSNELLRECRAIDNTTALYGCLLTNLKPRPPLERTRLVAELLEDNDLTEADLKLPEMLSWNELKELARHPLVDIGSHTMSHPYLPSMRLNLAWQEIQEGKRRLESQLSCPVECFAYPYGANNWRTRWMVRAAGFKYGFSTGNTGKGRMAIPRTNVVDWVGKGE